MMSDRIDLATILSNSARELRKVRQSSGCTTVVPRMGIEPFLIPLAVLSSFALSPEPVYGQERDPGCCSRFDFVLERTLLRVDVLHFKLTVDEQTGTRVRELLQGLLDGPELERAVTAVYMDARHADIELAFLRSIEMDQFLNGREETLEELVKGGYVDDETAERTARYNEQRFAFLADAGIRAGDRLTYSLRADSIRTRYTSESGAVLLNDVRVGPTPRAVLLGSFFAPGTTFHEPIWDRIRSSRGPRSP